MCCCAKQGHIFEKSLFAPKIGKMGQNQGFLNLLEKLVIFFWIWSIKKIYICCTVAQIPYLQKIWFLRYGPNALDQSDCILNWLYLLNKNNEKAWFFACWCRFIEIKSWLKNIGVGVVKKWVWQLWSQEIKIGCISRRNQ